MARAFDELAADCSSDPDQARDPDRGFRNP
jgi:hypothetical protein